jgi:hypothetical protein
VREVSVVEGGQAECPNEVQADRHRDAEAIEWHERSEKNAQVNE